MKKILFFLLTLLLFAGVTYAQTDDSSWYDWNGRIHIELLNDDGQHVDSLKAWISSADCVYLCHISPSYYYRLAYFGMQDSTKIIVTNEYNDIVYKKDLSKPYIDFCMNYLGIDRGEYTPNGIYTLHVYWNKCWWRGDFKFKSHWPEGQAAYIDSTYYLLNKGYASTVWPEYYLGNRRTVTHRMDWMIFERDYPLHVVIPSELTYEGETYKVTRIDNASFKGCYYMLSISLPNTITSIGNGAFLHCENLRRITIPESVTELGLYVFSECVSLSEIVIPEGITTLGNQMFLHCRSLSAVTLPSSLTFIDYLAFGHCTALPYIEIPDNVTSIGESAFQACENLMEIKLPKKLARIESNTFRRCKLLKSIEIPERVRSIGTEAFAGCSSLTSVTIPEGMSSIDELAFTDLPNTAHIYCKAQKPFKIAARSFNYNCTLHVPQGCKEAYEEADFWKNFTTIVEDEEKNGTEYIFAGDMTGVEPAVEAESAERFYDLQGRPVDGTQKGILIRNGKKVLIK